MGAYTSTPNWDAFLGSVWGWPNEVFGIGAFTGASNVVVGTNPPFTLQDFIAMYPKFGGVPVVQPVTLTQVSANVSVANGALFNPGQPIMDNAGAFVDGTVIETIAGNLLTLSNVASSSGSNIGFTVWNAPPIPFVVVSAYLYMATAALPQARWLEMWGVAIGWYVAHFLTLYARSDGNPASTVGQIAAQGIATGIQVAKHVGDISVQYQAVQGIEDWAAWNLTSYGQQLATMAKVVGSGPMLLY